MWLAVARNALASEVDLACFAMANPQFRFQNGYTPMTGPRPGRIGARLIQRKTAAVNVGQTPRDPGN
jgi:hypothetical protein